MAIGDRKYIFNKVNFYLKQENKFFTSSELHELIGVDAFIEIAKELSYPKTNYSTYVSSGVWQISTPADFLKIDPTRQMVYKDSSNSYKLAPKNQTNIGRHNILTATPGTPENYFMEREDMIGVYPPSTSGVIVIPYVKEPTSLSSDTTTNELSRRCYWAATYWTVAQCMLKDNDARFSTYNALYENKINKLKSEYGEMFEEEKALEPHEDYL